ncbi:MAG: nitronate monooxygenase, partial [Candidatus Heimdallarchaeaceae archaeon]
MKIVNEIKKELQLRYPIFGYNPIGLDDPQLAIKLSQLEGVGLVNFTGLNKQETMKILSQCKSDLSDTSLWGIRLDSSEQIDWIEDSISIPIIIIPFIPNTQSLAKLRKRARWLVAEVLYLEEAKEKASWADFFLVKGSEAGGMIGTKASFIQIQEFYEAGFPFLIQGGIGAYNIAAALIGGALGVVLEGQLYQFPECPLSQEKKEFLTSLGENDTYIVNESGDYRYRLAGKLANKVIRKIKEWEREKSIDKAQVDEIKELEKIEPTNFGFKSPDIRHSFLPLGVDLCFGTYIKEKYHSLQGFLEGINKLVQEQIREVNANWPFTENSDFAKNVGIRYPIIQGPMANISDNVMFAEKVAESGVLPILALGGLMKYETEELFDQVRKSNLPNNPYGCGIIGLEAVKKRREEHLELIQELKPPFVLIAAGTVNLGLRVKDMGFRVLLH